jgi:signal transduction histidine kinase
VSVGWLLLLLSRWDLDCSEQPWPGGGQGRGRGGLGGIHQPGAHPASCSPPRLHQVLVNLIMNIIMNIIMNSMITAAY